MTSTSTSLLPISQHQPYHRSPRCPQTKMSQPLLTPTSQSLSHSPPRTPPPDSWIHLLHHHCFHEVLKQKQNEVRHLLSKQSTHSADEQDTYLLARLLTKFSQKHPHHTHCCYCQSRPSHINDLSVSNRITRNISTSLPLEYQHAFRDGYFRSVADGLVTLSAPLMGVGRWGEVWDFVELTRAYSGDVTSKAEGDNQQVKVDGSTASKDYQTRKRQPKWRREVIQYGPHEKQHIDLFYPENNKDKSTAPYRGLITFIHGGAWGSGHPWMYRLVAPYFLRQNFLVAIVGYRTYPCVRSVTMDVSTDGETSQLCDIQDAWEALQTVREEVEKYSHTKGYVGNVLMGHSSGAHIALLMLVDMVTERQRGSSNDNSTASPKKEYPDYFVGLAGPYDIGNHFDYEAMRGVEQISPMKAICGGTRDNFSVVSPISRMMFNLTTTPAGHTTNGQLPPILLIHGVEDTTVPFTATADAARSLRSSGLFVVDEVYLDKCGHEDVVTQFMFGGEARDFTMNYLLDGEKRRSKVEIQSRL